MLSVLLKLSLLFYYIPSVRPFNQKNLTSLSPLYPNTTFIPSNSYEYGDGKCLSNLNCFLPYGVCLNETTCLCMPEYADIKDTQLFCSYKRKKVIVAGLLELFLPFGLGHIYAGNYIIGIAKFIYNIVIYSFCCMIYCKGYDNPNIMKMLFLCTFLTCLIPVWNIVDLFLFFGGIYKDGFGIPMI